MWCPPGVKGALHQATLHHPQVERWKDERRRAEVPVRLHYTYTLMYI